MLAYSMQDMILEPFAGLMFGYTPGQSTSLSGLQHMGVLVGMILVGIGGSAFGRGKPRALRSWTVAGCLGSALALVGLAMAAHLAPRWPIGANIAMLGFFNGMFAVAAIGSMMALAGERAGNGAVRHEGIRMGVWGAAQALAFGLGGLTGAVGVDALRGLAHSNGSAFGSVFAAEALLFLLSAWIATSAVSAAKPFSQREALA
jgi:BCD family chlorophyll transporter-like MFS transporter